MTYFREVKEVFWAEGFMECLMLRCAEPLDGNLLWEPEL